MTKTKLMTLDDHVEKLDQEIRTITAQMQEEAMERAMAREMTADLNDNHPEKDFAVKIKKFLEKEEEKPNSILPLKTIGLAFALGVSSLLFTTDSAAVPKDKTPQQTLRL